MKKVVWGVLSTAKIGLERVLPGMLKSPTCEIRAIASRSLTVARRAADKLGIPKAYGTYEWEPIVLNKGGQGQLEAEIRESIAGLGSLVRILRPALP